MVGIVLVSHSRPLARAVVGLVHAMTGEDFPVAVAAGAGEGHGLPGTDAVEVAEAIRSVMHGGDGVLVLMDLGSAVLSAETALDLLDDAERGRVRLVAAPFVEGAIAAGVAANVGGTLDQVADEARGALRPKQEHLRDSPGAATATTAAATPAPAAPAAVPARPGTCPTPSADVTIRHAHGLHARPTALLSRAAKRFDADVRIENLSARRGPVPANSLIGLLSLEVGQGHDVRLTATGPQAAAAIAALRELLETGLDEPPAAPPAAPPHPGDVGADRRPDRAQPVSDGIAVGPAVFVDSADADGQPTPSTRQPANAAAEKAKLRAALAAARAGLVRQEEQARRSAGPSAAGIFAAQAVLLDDPALAGRAEELIDRDNATAAAAWRQTYLDHAARVEGLHDDYLRHRAADVRDAGLRVLAELGAAAGGGGGPPYVALPGAVLVTDDLTPTRASELAGGGVAGVVLLDGGRTSHAAVLLRATGVPAVAQARLLLAGLARDRAGVRVALDGATGEVWVDPDDGRLADLTDRRAVREAARARERAAADEPAVTTDGHPVAVMANVGRAADADAAVRAGAEGVGLVRTEFVFLGRDTLPTEDEQVAALEPIFAGLGDRPVVVRTLDAGGDKDLPYLGLPREANPALGVRGLRLCLRRPDVFAPHLRALLRAGAGRRVRLLYPMVSGPAELREAAGHLEAAHAVLAAAGVPHAWPVPVGVMVEVPSAALLADELAAACDFFSIGTNDLTQYTLAADRAGGGELADYRDALHPAVLRLVRSVVEAAHRRGKPVAVCGEAAGDVPAALVFVGLGVDELSMAPAAVGAVKAAVRGASWADLRRLAADAAESPDPAGVRQRVAGLVAAGG